MRGLLVALLLGLCAGAPALAQAPAAPSPGNGDLAALRRDFEFGKYDEAFVKARARLDAGVNTEPEVLLELHQIAGISAFNLGRHGDAERHLTAVLRIDPDFALDPFVYPPATVNFLERLKRQLATELEGIRQERRVEAARRRAEQEAAERQRVLAEEQRRRIEALSRRLTVRTMERRNFFVNFVPFGAGQFQQGRANLGILMASTQAALAATSVIAFWAHEALYETKLIDVPGAVNPDGSPYRISVTAIPDSRKGEAQTWRIIKTVSAIGFYGMYAYGVLDSAMHHQDLVVTGETTVELPPEGTPDPAAPSTPPAPAPTDGPSTGAAPAASPLSSTPPARPSWVTYVAPLPGGVGAGLSVTF